MRLIDADALRKQWSADDCCEHDYTHLHFLESIDSAPTIEEHKTGKWIYLLDGSGNVECSECCVEQPIDSYYCPWCGAKMELPGLMKSIKQWEEAIDECGYIN